MCQSEVELLRAKMLRVYDSRVSGGYKDGPLSQAVNPPVVLHLPPCG